MTAVEGEQPVRVGWVPQGPGDPGWNTDPVTGDAISHEPHPGLVRAPADSPLAGLARRLEDAKRELFLDLAVPGYRDKLGLDLYVRFRPLATGVLQKLGDIAEKSKNPDRFVVLNANALANSCLGIFYLDEAGNERAFADDPDGPWPTFDRSTAALLGKSYVSPAEVVRDLYFTDAQIIGVGSQLQTWSAGEIAEREKDAAGN